MYLDGDGVSESVSIGAHWVDLAYKQGNEEAAEMINEYELWDDVNDWYK